MIEKQPTELYIFARLTALDKLIACLLRTVPDRTAILDSAESMLAHDADLARADPAVGSRSQIILDGAVEVLRSIRDDLHRLEVN